MIQAMRIFLSCRNRARPHRAVYDQQSEEGNPRECYFKDTFGERLHWDVLTDNSLGDVEIIDIFWETFIFSTSTEQFISEWASIAKVVTLLIGRGKISTLATHVIVGQTMCQ